jgi:hypothetical protein
LLAATGQPAAGMIEEEDEDGKCGKLNDQKDFGSV